MGAIRTSADSAFRDFTTAGVPASGDHKPIKADVRAFAGIVEGRIDDIKATALTGVRFLTQTIRVRSTANVVLASALKNGDTLNGVTLATGDYVFLGSQTAPAENGIYTVVASGAASRATFADSAAELARVGFVIMAGTVGAGERWTLPLDAAAITVGTTALNFAPLGIEVSYATAINARLDLTDADVKLVRQSTLGVFQAPQVTIDGFVADPIRVSSDGYVMTAEILDTGDQWRWNAGSDQKTYASFDAYAGGPADITAVTKMVAEGFGQSNSIGCGNQNIVGQALTTVAKYTGRARMFNGGPKADSDSSGSTMASLSDLVEDTTAGKNATYSGETFIAGFVHGFLGRAQNALGGALTGLPIVGGHTAGRGGTAIGPLFSTYYTRFTTALTRWFSLFGAGSTVGVILYDGNEADQGHLAQAAYRTAWRAAYNQMVASAIGITSQSWNPIMLTTQKSWGAFQGAGTLPDSTTNTYPCSVTLAQLAEQGSGIFLIGPDYAFPWSGDKIHRSPVGHKLVGLQASRVAVEVLVRKKDWRAAHMASAWAIGNKIYVRIAAPVLPVVVDYAGWTCSQAGFRVDDGSGTPTLSGIRRFAPDVIEATMSRAIIGTTFTVSYGLDHALSTNADVAGGNIRDSDTETVTVDGNGYLLANWLLAGRLTGAVLEA